MRLVYLLLGCLMLGLCSMTHALPDSSVSAQETSVVEGKRPKPPKPPKPDRNHRHDDEVKPAPEPTPAPIPPRPKPEPDPNFNKVRPLPPHVGPVIPVPNVKPFEAGFIRWLLTGAVALVRFVLVCVAVAVVAFVVWRTRWSR